MAYKTADLKKQALEAIEKHKLFFIEDVIAFLPCSKPTYYEHKLNESDDIKAALEKNIIEVKTSLRSKWYKSNAPALQMALYKIIADDSERKKLSMTHTDITTDGEKIKGATIVFADEPDNDTTLS